MGKLKEDFARIAPFLVADMVSLLQRVPVYPDIKSNLVFGIYKILDACDKHSLAFLKSNLAEGALEMYKYLLDTYNQHHKFNRRNKIL